MVARPPVRLLVEPMGPDDIPAVHAIESASFPTPWPPYAFRQELETNSPHHGAEFSVSRFSPRFNHRAAISILHGGCVHPFEELALTAVVRH